MNDLQRGDRARADAAPAGGSPGDPDDVPEPWPIRRLRWLVTALLLVLITGMIVVSATLVIRLTGLSETSRQAAPITAEALTLPAGERAVALGRSGAGVMVLTRDGEGDERLHVIDAATGAILSTTPVRRAP